MNEDDILKLLITSGAVVNRKITRSQQNKVNRIMEPIIIKIIAAFEFFKNTHFNFLNNENNTCMTDFPNEIRNIICMTIMNGISQLPSIVLQKILKTNKTIQS